MTKPQKTKPRSRGRWSMGDVATAGGLSLVAVLAVAFPWHVHLNPESYEPPQMVFSRDRQAQDDLLYAFAVGEARFDLETGTWIAEMQLPDAVDPIATGTVPGSETDEMSRPVRIIEAGPAQLSLIAASRRRALVTDGSSIWLIEPGARLPGGERVTALDFREGRATLLTSEGQIVRQLADR